MLETIGLLDVKALKLRQVVERGDPKKIEAAVYSPRVNSKINFNSI